MVTEAVAVKNMLMVYEGGLYDGCIWEANWCLWDANGDWHDVYSSGCSGLKTKELAVEEYIWWLEHQDSSDYRDSKIMYVIDMDKEDDFDCLQNFETVALGNLLGSVNEKLAELKQPMTAWFKCTSCGNKHYPWSEEPGYPESLRGNGGVGHFGDDLLCPDCYSSHSCAYCGEYEEKAHEYQGYCEYCYKTALSHFYKTLDIGSIEWNKVWHEFNGKKEWTASEATVTSPEDFDRDWFEIEASDFVKPEKLDPDKEYLWVVESKGVDYFIRAKTEQEAHDDCERVLGSCEDVTPAWDAFEFDVEAEHRAAREEEQRKRLEEMAKK